MPWVPVLVAAGFIVGVFVGVMWRESVELLLGRDDPMRMIQRTKSVASAALGHRTTVATWAVVLAIMLNVGVAGAVLYTNNRANHLSSDQRAQVVCNTRFNRLSSEARDDRLAAQSAAAVSEIGIVHADLDVWRGLRDRLTDTHGTLDDVLRVIDKRIHHGQTYLATLVHQQNVRARHGYPPANYCTKKGGGLR